MGARKTQTLEFDILILFSLYSTIKSAFNQNKQLSISVTLEFNLLNHYPYPGTGLGSQGKVCQPVITLFSSANSNLRVCYLSLVK